MLECSFKHLEDATNKFLKCIDSCETEKQLDNTRRWIEDYYLRERKRRNNLYTANIHEKVLNIIDIRTKIIRLGFN